MAETPSALDLINRHGFGPEDIYALAMLPGVMLCRLAVGSGLETRSEDKSSRLVLNPAQVSSHALHHSNLCRWHGGWDLPDRRGLTSRQLRERDDAAI
jgi:hypothetical protein